MLVPEEGHCHRLQIQSPTLTTPEFLAIAALPQTNPGLGWTTSVRPHMCRAPVTN